MAFNHENLRVYQRTLLFKRKVGRWLEDWDPRHAICDHLPRAAGSVLENIAMASAAYSAMKVRSLEYAVGSVLECAACLDLAGVKHPMDAKRLACEKEELSQIFRMLVGLHRSWSSAIVKEATPEYGAASDGDASGKAGDHPGGNPVFFHHEELDVYCAALRAAEMFSSSAAVGRLSSSVFRRLDELLTSIVLNIAEGNGRFRATDQRRFIGRSHEAAIKLAARLDLCALEGAIPAAEVERCKGLLARVVAMTTAMIKAGGV